MGNWLTPLVQKHIEKKDSVLDLGCGIMSVTYDIQCRSILGVDAWYPYVNLNKNRHHVLCMELNQDTMEYFLNDSFNVVIALDFVEHLNTKEDGFHMIKHMERIARKKVIVFTPIGFEPMDDGELWAKGNPKYQSHKCGFTEDEFKMMGYTLSHHKSNIKGKQIRTMLAIKDIRNGNKDT